jgi:hypothetical protein
MLEISLPTKIQGHSFYEFQNKTKIVNLIQLIQVILIIELRYNSRFELLFLVL